MRALLQLADLVQKLSANFASFWAISPIVSILLRHSLYSIVSGARIQWNVLDSKVQDPTVHLQKCQGTLSLKVDLAHRQWLSHDQGAHVMHVS
jgi:hypothetical protein